MIINNNKGVERTGKRYKARTIQQIKLQRLRDNYKKPVLLRSKTPNLSSDVGSNG